MKHLISALFLFSVIIIAACAKRKDRVVQGKMIYTVTSEAVTNKTYRIVVIHKPLGAKKETTHSFAFTTDTSGKFSVRIEAKKGEYACISDNAANGEAGYTCNWPIELGTKATDIDAGIINVPKP